MIPKIELEKYNYELDDELIAIYPTEKRGDSKLLSVNKSNNTINHLKFDNIVDLLPSDSLLFINDTKVISARILMQKITGAKIELLLFEPLNANKDFQIGLSELSESKWKCIVGGKVKIGTTLITQINGSINLKAEILDKSENEVSVLFSWDNPNISFAEVLIEFGNIPLPPYIKRNATLSDSDRYQTVFANILGSVAAPTAALHFNESILEKIQNKNIGINKLTLHVGLGTFKPINCENIEEHKMHNEPFYVPKECLSNLLNELSKEHPHIIATGTTSTRTLESLYWIGMKIIINEKININYTEFNQWDCYNLKLDNMPSSKEAIQAIIDELEKNDLDILVGQTELIIIPGYQFKIVSSIITNFHAPHSTLILLVAAFLGYDLWKKTYQEAIDNKYRFLSYGDSSFLT